MASVHPVSRACHKDWSPYWRRHTAMHQDCMAYFGWVLCWCQAIFRHNQVCNPAFLFQYRGWSFWEQPAHLCTIWREIFKEHNFRVFSGWAPNCKNCAVQAFGGIHSLTSFVVELDTMPQVTWLFFAIWKSERGWDTARPPRSAC